MELRLRDGDYVPDSTGGLVTVEGREALLQRVLLRLSAHRGMFPFMDEFGSRLWQLGRVSPAERQSAAEQYVAEALEAEQDLQLKSVILEHGKEDALGIVVRLDYAGEELSVRMEVR